MLQSSQPITRISFEESELLCVLVLRYTQTSCQYGTDSSLIDFGCPKGYRSAYG
jgi:hypothetical protein